MKSARATKNKHNHMGRGNLPVEVMVAARDGDVQRMREAFRDGTSLPDASDEIGQTCLHFASMWGHAAAVIELIKIFGADPNVENDDGFSPLWYAIRKGHCDVVRVLLERGAKTQKLGQLLSAAESAPNGADIVRMLHNIKGPSADILRAVKTLNVVKLKCLLEERKDRIQDVLLGWGRTPLHYAVLATIAIVEQRAEQNHVEPFGASEGVTILEMLVDAAKACGEGTLKAACAQLDEEGATPLHYFARAGFSGHPAALTLLLRAGADPNARSSPSVNEYTTGQWGKTSEGGQLEVR